MLSLLLLNLCQASSQPVDPSVTVTLSAVAKVLPPPKVLSVDLPSGFRPSAQTEQTKTIRRVPVKLVSDPYTSSGSYDSYASYDSPAAYTSSVSSYASTVTPTSPSSVLPLSSSTSSTQVRSRPFIITKFVPSSYDSVTSAATTPLTDAAVLALVTNSSEVPLSSNEKFAYSSQMFDQNSFRSWNIVMSQSDIDALNANPTLEESYPCSIISNYGTRHAITHSAPSFGCRYRGSVGSLRMCLNEFHRPNNECRKLSWSFKTDALKPKPKKIPTVHGAESLSFGGCPVDGSLMSERMAFSLLNKINVTASQATHAKLFLNGKFLGVYSFIQPVDELFTMQRFASDDNKGKGSLYKEVWFNQYGMENRMKNTKNFLSIVMAEIEKCPLTRDAALKLFERYFDIPSFVDVTAFNSVIGNSDDWRQRHNFFWYLREDNKGKKLVLIPWDYDRLYDSGSLTRGALAGNPWWDIKRTATPSNCNAPILSPEALAEQVASYPGEVALWIDVFKTLSPDVETPVSCDKITKLLALALGPQVRARTRELLKLISLDHIRDLFGVWSKQIEDAVRYDPDGPSIQKMKQEQDQLLAHLTQVRAIALYQANEGDRTFESESF